MEKEKSECCEKEMKKHHRKMDGGCGGLYGLAFIGAAIYFIGKATTFWIGVLGFLKALVWPAFLVYELLKFLNL